MHASPLTVWPKSFCSFFLYNSEAKNLEIQLTTVQYLELEKLALGAFSPLTGFMNEDDYTSVIETMRLPNGAPFPLPIVLDVEADTAKQAFQLGQIHLAFKGQVVGTLTPESYYPKDINGVTEKIFGTNSEQHPGVKNFMLMKPWLLGGTIKLDHRMQFEHSDFELTPQETKALFKSHGWKKITGFQTRNIPHRAHEYLQRIALEISDGLFIQPLVGQKKAGDFTSRAVLAGYEALIQNHFPKNRVAIGVLSTAMRYAGPREAIFHALIRRNYGCTHFIVGRDHAGVGNFYGLYSAQNLAKSFEEELGIEILALSGPFFSHRTEGIATERSVPENLIGTDDIVEISGTLIRQVLSGGKEPDPRLIRPTVVDALRGLDLFIKEDNT